MQLELQNFYLKNQVYLKNHFYSCENLFLKIKKEGNSIIVHVNPIYSDF